MTLAPKLTYACHSTDLSCPGSLSIHTNKQANPDVFIVRSDEGIFAYKNQCPHTGAPLNWQPDQFLSADNSLIQCALHSAQFNINDGHCIYGPCRNSSLKPVRLIEKHNEVWLFDDDLDQ